MNEHPCSTPVPDAASRRAPAAAATPLAATHPPGAPGVDGLADDTRERAALAQLVSLVPGIRLAIAMVVGSIIIAALYFGRNLLIPLALAILLGFLLDPLATRLKRWGLPRMVAILLVVSVALGGVAGLGTYLGSQLAALSESLPRYQSTMTQKLRDLRTSLGGPGMFDGLRDTMETLRQEISGQHNGSSHAPASAPTAITSPSPDPAGSGLQRVEVVPAAPTEVERAQTWLLRISQPLVMSGIVLLFVILILLDRDGLRDRLVRLVGGNINAATEALDEAALRIGKYLRMQLIVNATYGIPLAVGLWFIGVPGALLWGVLAALLRYIPYVGPALAAIFPLSLAFAVGDGWSMLVWTLALIATLELLSNNVVEPWLYGESTGLSTLAIIVSATFWTALWGPIGLILATPLSVCLLVLGRTIPALGFLDVILGSEPVLSPAQRLYQRLLVENVDGALELSEAAIQENLPDGAQDGDRPSAVVHYYDAMLVPALRLSNHLHTSVATAEQRFRFGNGMDALLEELQQEYPPAAHTLPGPGETATIHCLGVRWEVDATAAQAMAHGLRLYGHRTSVSTHALGARMNLDLLPDLAPCSVLCLSTFSPEPQAQIRHISRRIHQRWPHVHIIAGVWSAPGTLLTPEVSERLSVDHLVNRMHEMAMRIHHAFGDAAALEYTPAALPANEDRRLQALRASRALAAEQFALYRDMVWRAVNAFDLKHAQVSLIDEEWVHTPGTSLVAQDEASLQAGLPRSQSVCAYVARNGAPFVVADTQRDPRFARNPTLLAHDIRFYAGVPLRTRKGEVIGALCVMDDAPHDADAIDLELLEHMASELMLGVRKTAIATSDKSGSPTTPAAPGPAAAPAGANDQATPLPAPHHALPG